MFSSAGDAGFDVEEQYREEKSRPMDTDAFATQNSTDHGLNNEAADERMPSMQDLDNYLAGAYDYQAPQHGDIRQGVVVTINDNGAIMDIGFKREGFVPAEDLSRLDEDLRASVQVGATIPVFVLRPADREGRPVLSIHQANMYKDWLQAEEMMKSGELYEGEVSGHNRGGLIVKFGRIRGFVPASQVVGLPRRLREEQRQQRLAAMIGENIGLRVIEVDRHRRRLIFSQRRAFRAWQEMQRERVIQELREGETRHGRVSSITDFGAFVDLGGADGLVHVSELSWRRVDHPREVLKVGDEVDVYILGVDRQRKRIALSIKKLQPDPWTMVDDHYRTDQLVEGRVTRVLDFGAFVALDLGIEGLLHAREMIGTPELSPSDIVQSGDVLPVKIIGIDSHRRRLDLSAKQVRQDEWERWVAEQQMAQQEAAAVPAAAEEMEGEAAVPKLESVAEEGVAAPADAEAVAEKSAEQAAVVLASEEATMPAVAEVEAEAAVPELESVAEEGVVAPADAEAVAEKSAEQAAVVLASEEATMPAVAEVEAEAAVPELESVAEEGVVAPANAEEEAAAEPEDMEADELIVEEPDSQDPLVPGAAKAD
jgi:small subunit ribosomal protein S1